MDAYTKQYLKDRENDREKFGYYSLPISMEEFEEDNQKTWDQYLRIKRTGKNGQNWILYLWLPMLPALVI